MSPEPLWTTDDVATYLKVSVWTVRKWRQNNKIPFLKIEGSVRYDPDAVRTWAGGVTPLPA